MKKTTTNPANLTRNDNLLCNGKPCWLLYNIDNESETCAVTFASNPDKAVWLKVADLTRA